MRFLRGGVSVTSVVQHVPGAVWPIMHGAFELLAQEGEPDQLTLGVPAGGIGCVAVIDGMLGKDIGVGCKRCAETSGCVADWTGE